MSNTNIGSRIFFSPTPRPTRMTEAEFEAITDWEETGCVTTVGEIGGTAEETTANCWGTGEQIVGRGIRVNGAPTFEFIWDYTNAAYQAIRDAEKGNFNYAMKIEYSNAPDDTMTGTVVYLRGRVAGYTIPNGAAEDFQMRSFTLNLAQPHIEVDPQVI